jgi:hypothetical protein
MGGTTLFYVFELAGLNSLSKAYAEVRAPRGFAGNVEVHRSALVDSEQLVQIIDNDRSVVCYGKISTGGASTISCQKFERTPPK